jgi:hypothetical protein
MMIYLRKLANRACAVLRKNNETPRERNLFAILLTTTLKAAGDFGRAVLCPLLQILFIFAFNDVIVPTNEE